MDPDQSSLLKEQSDLCIHCLIERLLNHFCRQQHRTKYVMIGALRLNQKEESIVQKGIKSSAYLRKNSPPTLGANSLHSE